MDKNQERYKEAISDAAQMARTSRKAGVGNKIVRVVVFSFLCGTCAMAEIIKGDSELKKLISKRLDRINDAKRRKNFRSLMDSLMA